MQTSSPARTLSGRETGTHAALRMESAHQGQEEMRNNGMTRRPRGIAPSGILYHPKSGDGIVMTAWCTRASVGETRVTFNLGVNRRRAETLDRDIRARLVGGQSVDAVKRHLMAQLGSAGAAEVLLPVTIAVPAVDSQGHIIATFRDLIRVRSTRALEAKGRVTRRYMMSLLNLVEDTLRVRVGKEPLDRSGRRVDYDDYAQILDLPLAVLDESLAVDFKDWRLRRARETKDNEWSTKVSANTEIRQARAVFGEEARGHYRSAGLRLPNLEEFFGVGFFKKVTRLRSPPHESVVRHLHAEFAKVSREPLFLTLALALHGGLRRGEIETAHSDCLQTTEGLSFIVGRSPGFETKSGDERTVPLPPWLFGRLQAKGHGFLTGATESARNQVADEAVTWLRHHGFEVIKKPLHGLRGIFAGYLLRRRNTADVLDILGHRDIRTTITHYSRRPLSEDLATLWEEPLPGVAAGTE